jgi:hypothetical protein
MSGERPERLAGNRGAAIASMAARLPRLSATLGVPERLIRHERKSFRTSRRDERGGERFRAMCNPAYAQVDYRCGFVVT